MLKETSELLKEYYGLDDETFELSNEVMEDIKEQFDKIKENEVFKWYCFIVTGFSLIFAGLLYFDGIDRLPDCPLRDTEGPGNLRLGVA